MPGACVLYLHNKNSTPSNAMCHIIKTMCHNQKPFFHTSKNKTKTVIGKNAQK